MNHFFPQRNSEKVIPSLGSSQKLISIVSGVQSCHTKQEVHSGMITANHYAMFLDLQKHNDL